MTPQKTWQAKACAKFILLGEHFVVHQSAPAVAFPLRGLSCIVRITPNHHPHYLAKLPHSHHDRDFIESNMARAVYATADALRVDVTSQPLRVESESDFPLGRGFGSSGAFAVALARALGEYRKSFSLDLVSNEELEKASFSVERIFHGNPSGVDTAVILAENPIYFEKKGVTRTIRNCAVDFVVVDSGPREGCAALVKQVSLLRQQDPVQWEHLSNTLRQMVGESEEALRVGRDVIVTKVVSAAHEMLAQLGLSTPTIEAILKDGIKCGALSGKVSGAGGGGAVVLVCSLGKGDFVAQRLKALGHVVLAVEKGESK